MGYQAALPSPPPHFCSGEVVGSWAQRPALGESFFIALLRGEFFPLPLTSVFACAISLELHGVPSSAAIASAIILTPMKSLAPGLGAKHSGSVYLSRGCAKNPPPSIDLHLHRCHILGATWGAKQPCHRRRHILDPIRSLATGIGSQHSRRASSLRWCAGSCPPLPLISVFAGAISLELS